MRKFSYFIFSILLLTQTCLAFDSERQGLVLEAGVGFAPTISTEISSFSSTNEKSSAVSGIILAGYGFNENAQFFLMLNGSQGDSFPADSVSEKIWQGFTGVGVRFYFDDIGSSFFITSGIGLQLYLNSDNAEFSHDTGLGFLVGGGYEFAEHFHLQTSILNGKTKDSFNWNHMQLNFTVSFILY